MEDSKAKVSQAPAENAKPAVKKETYTAKLKKQYNELKEKHEELQAKYAALQADIDTEVDNRTKRRISEKDKYLAGVEEECDAKVANKDVIISALRSDIERLNHKITQLQSSSKNSGGLAVFLGKLFTKK